MARRVDVSIRALDAPFAAANAHGILGQAFAFSGPVNGREDVYPDAGRMTTAAQAEGVLEGVYTAYRLAEGSYGTRFGYSRFDSAPRAATSATSATGSATARTAVAEAVSLRSSSSSEDRRD
ncbi:MAG: hypothetical protein GY911_05020 [Actinomycetales bacterium]|nr:hypothetical protein [Actinomycetales bacterium]